MADGMLTYVVAMQDLHQRADMLSSRAIRNKIAEAGHKISHATVHEILNGTRLSGWIRTRWVVEALGGDPEEVQPLWIRATYEKRGGPPTNGTLRDQVVADELVSIRELLERIAKRMGA
jgi:hypothetical protein